MAVTNIQIPLLLGTVVNVLTRFTGEGADVGSNFFAAVQGPALKLVAIYGAQVLTVTDCNRLKFLFIAFACDK